MYSTCWTVEFFTLRESLRFRWIRGLMRRLAGEGRTVLLSSHLMSEMELVADHLVVIGRGRLIADTSMRDFIERNSRAVTAVRSPEATRLKAVLEAAGAEVQLDPTGAWRVSGPDAAAIGDLARHHGLTLHELTPRRSSLEEVYTRMTQSSTDYRAADQATGGGSPPEPRRFPTHQEALTP